MATKSGVSPLRKLGASNLPERALTAGTQARPRAEAPWTLLVMGLVASDALALGFAFALAYAIRFEAGLPLLETPPYDIAFYAALSVLAVPLWIMMLAMYHLYDRHYLFVGPREYVQLVNACTAGLLAIIVASFLDVTLSISRGWLVLVWLLSIVMLSSNRFLARRAVRWLRARGLFSVPTVIVGANEEGKALAEQLVGDRGSGVKVVGFIDGSLPPGTPVFGELANLGALPDLERMVRAGAVSEVILATTSLSREGLLDLYRSIGHVEDVEVRLSSGLFEILTTGVRVQEISGVSLMTPLRVRITGLDAVLKAALDYLGSLLCLAILSPLMLAVAVAVRVDSPGPILHRRTVLGQGGRPFTAYKFRTMVANADEVLAQNPELREAYAKGCKLKDDPRVTRLGKLLRRTSLDELPQLFNVLRGDMSLVGPRMIVPEEAERYGKWQLNLLTVKPGISGPWQVSGRAEVAYEDRVKMSMHYIRNYSIWLDLGILLRTILIVAQRKGAY